MSVPPDHHQRRIRISQVFTPSAPVDTYTLFAGRTSQLERVVNAVVQKGQHAIVYGERGVGKTSLVNVLTDFFNRGLQQEGQSEPSISIRYARVNCDTQDNFMTILQKAFREIEVSLETKPIGFQSGLEKQQVSMGALINKDTTPEGVRKLLDDIGGINIIVIDELDRVGDKSAKTMIADTIKTLSDHASLSTIILVGVLTMSQT